MAWLEVETKVKIPSDEVAGLRDRIKKIARFKKKGQKVDDYFAICFNDKYPKKAFRIRAMKDTFEITFKKWLRRYWTKEVVVKQEYEFKLKGKKEVENLLELFRDLGFEEWVRKTKRNETYVYKKNDRINIEINYVKHLGYFMEIEYLATKSEMKSARNNIMRVLKELGIPKKWINNKGYTKMLWERGTLDKRKFIL
ncbi:class IV adenylate cyclase [Candidatus Pacearchaeota archaeon]|nr:class IV adenylate cyclase [Candidatus Pacearchaeota archaeon]|tara:strand:+ start:1641 stop:2231 length:591 start_codon:yes stop_codon:yes gene_type:complete